MFNYRKVAETVKNNDEAFGLNNFFCLDAMLTEGSNLTDGYPCYNFAGELDRSGYGRFHIPELKIVVPPHYFLWISLRQELPDGMALVHICGNPICCQLHHLEIITPTEYFLRIYEGRFPLPVKNIPNSKYDSREVLTIKFLARRVGLHFEMISDIMGIPQHAIRRLSSHKSWRHLEPELRKMSLSFPEPKKGSRSAEFWKMKFREFYERYELFKPMIRNESLLDEQPKALSGATDRIQIVSLK